ncbi:MAG: GNAT family N-acetyltransferase [Desulfobacteraceae bacterium]|jgi:GNAT superfamily N-acetyltransferase
MLKIYPAKTHDDIEVARSILGEYLACRESEKSIFPEELQAFRKQIAELPAEFAEPGGCLLLAKFDEEVAGCVCLRDLGDNICEMKRLFVKPEWRNQGIGKALAKEIIEKAKPIGYSYIRIDTFNEAAKKVYTSIGFYKIQPYRYNPTEGIEFMELKLI